MICNKDEKGIELASEFLREGKICVLPTDTVYGFSGIAENTGAPVFYTDSKIRKIKGRDCRKPFIQLVSSVEEVERYSACRIPDFLAQKWPGALTVIVPVNLCFDERTENIAFRCPGDEWLRKLIEECGLPIYSTSANRSGQPILESARSIEEEFGDEVSLIVDGGEKKGGVPSTIVALEGSGWRVVRQGSVTV
ncbi:L-threonylcarbamoyladenylate synthase [Treponema sp.]|uniref:L-threonylcarbamoyladenylate synthase n=1 Tax=Treponema sp. TaxID=166 RepID=UPI003F00B9BB